jgi:uncharacterized protein YggE
MFIKKREKTMEMYSQASQNSPLKNKLTLDLRIVVLVLVGAIVAMLITWKPWVGTVSEERILETTGEASLTDTPDEFVFMPTYQFKNANKDIALAELTSKSDEVIAKLKALKVPDNKIKTNSTGFDFPVYYEDNSDELTYSLQLTITVSDAELAQKVQDYLITTSPTGMVSPQANFSDDKRRELETKARDLATKDARSKAEQTASNLGFKLGKVKSVTDSQGFGILPYAERGSVSIDSSTVSPTLAVQPGENELNYTVTVVFYMK